MRVSTVGRRSRARATPKIRAYATAAAITAGLDIRVMTQSPNTQIAPAMAAAPSTGQSIRTLRSVGQDDPAVMNTGPAEQARRLCVLPPDHAAVGPARPCRGSCLRNLR